MDVHEYTDAAAPQISRRTIVKGGAWSVPVVAAAMAVPMAAASGDGGGADNDVSMYYWNEAANASAASLQYDDLDTPGTGTYSVQVSLRAEAWELPNWPSDAVAVLTVVFDQPIEPSGTLLSGISGSGTTWTYTLPLSAVGTTPNTYFNFHAPAGGAWPSSAVVRMRIDNPGALTWPTQGVRTTPGITQYDPANSVLVP